MEIIQSSNTTSSGWFNDVLMCVDRIAGQTFSLGEMYTFESELQAKYPNNHHVREKICQQLQFLRDKSFIEFLGRGEYRKIHIP